MGFRMSRRWLQAAAASLGLLATLSTARAVDFPPPPPGQGGPSRTAGGGVRAGDTCVVKGEGVTPSVSIAPPNNVATTVAAEPTFYIYVPENTALAVELVISDSDLNEQFGELTLPAEVREAMAAGPTLLKVVAANTMLEPGKIYNWSFALLCDTVDLSNAEVVEGAVQRVPTPRDLWLALNSATSLLERANAYAAAGIWSEAADLALRMRDDKPEEWEQLVRSTIDPNEEKDVEGVDLNDLFDAPLYTLTVELEAR